MGGRTPTNSDEIDYINISSTGNSTDFGNLLATSQVGVSLTVKHLQVLEYLLWVDQPHLMTYNRLP